MPTLNEIKNKIPEIHSSIITIGNFDGVHVGHQAIFQKLIEFGKLKKASSVVFLLFPHPKEVFTGSSPALLSTLEDRKKLIQNLGIDHVLELTFDIALSEMSALELLQKFQSDFHMKHLVVGSTTHIGKNREGTPEHIRELAKILKFDVSVIDPFEVKGCKVSSSFIRNHIGRGEVNLAADMLGRFYSTRGIVETGMGKGRGFGFPTANIGQNQTMIPTRGVYAGYALVGGGKYKAAINVGTRPTVTSDKTCVVECHLIDFDEKIVGHDIEVQWVERLREEVKFDSIDQLIIQIAADVGKVKDIL